MHLRFTYAFLIASSLSASAQIRINEVMASNTRAYPDITDFEDYPDWLELYNSSAEEQSLRGYFLSDDPEIPKKWEFADNAGIPAGGYLVVIADGRDTPLGERLRRSSFGRPFFTTEKHHTNFSLSAEGETLSLSKVTRTSEILIAEGSTWRYLDDGSDQGITWRSPDFDDSAWASGAAPLGYGDPVATTLSFGDTNDRHITSYLRTNFELLNPTQHEKFTLNLTVDDAAIIYLNGTQIVRQNLPEGFIDFQTTAVSAITPAIEEVVTSYDIAVDLLREGTNHLTVEVHQIHNLSQDMRFDLSLTATQSSPLTIIDSIDYTQQVSDVSLGRSPEGPEIWVQFAESTAGSENKGPIVESLREESDAVTISPAGGLLTEATQVTLNCEEGTIYYTLDGSNPSTDSIRYTAPINIATTTVVRARCFADERIPGPIATRTYFLGETFQTLPYLSVVADPETLFGDRIGIYYNQHEAVVGSGPSVYKGKDAPGHLEFFPPDGSEGFGVNGGFRIGGENNWASHFQRALNFTTRGKYGDDSINYDLFPGSGIPRFTALTLREGGDDWGKAHLTDAIFDSIVRGRMEVETNRYRPSALFINGAYWGLYNIRDRWNDNWFFQEYGTNDGEYDRINTGNDGDVENGSDEDWLKLLTFLDSNDITQPDIWAEAQKRIDITSAIDFVIVESYGRNSSWGGNREVWKDSRPGSKWRFLIPDMDRTFGNTRENRIMAGLLTNDQLVSRLFPHPEFQRFLAQRYAAHLASTLKAERVINLIDTLGSAAIIEQTRQFDRWNAPSRTAYEDALVRMKDFVNSYGNLSEVQSTLDLSQPIDLTLSVTGSGNFELEGVPIEAGTLQVFPNIAIKLIATPAPGYRFESWSGLDDDASLETTLNGDRSLTANFVLDAGIEAGGTLTQDTTFTSSRSPYFITSDFIVPVGRTLTMREGTVVEMARGKHFRVEGTLNIEGSEANPIQITGSRGQSWGGISFERTTTTSSLSHLEIRHASRGADPVNYPAAISGLDADLVIEHLNIDEGLAPLFFRGGSLILRDSFISIPITGDGLNVKQGQAQTIRCTFLGNQSPDTDAIDYDGVIEGLIQDCRIYRFFGFNSDGIDTGERCINTVIEGNRIFFNSDKGISVGQGSSIIARNNLIVGCQQGIGVKDTGSVVNSDQNTFVDCEVGISVFEKNFGAGGGLAIIANTIFSDCKTPVNSDTFSNVSIVYSLSDTLPLPGTNNLNTEANFTDADILDFSLHPSSPARDSGDPAHVLDPDNTPADRGALYQYDPEDYPFLLNNTIVINEILANSGDEVDWIELHNRSNEARDISGWFLSDDGSDLAKYRIPENTVIPAGDYLIFYEDMHFGTASTAPGKITGFSLSNTGETVHLSSAIGDTLTDYRFKEKFGASFEGQTLGFYYKPSTDSYNFVAQKEATPAAPNSAPSVGPIVISEIMYDPQDDTSSEYLELLNISSETVNFTDLDLLTSWRMSDGIELTFSSDITLTPGERLLLVQDRNALASYNLPDTTKIVQWESGRLANGGETVQLERPGPLRDDGLRSYVRVDRVNYDDDSPWPITARGGGPSLSKISERDYGNDFANWTALPASPGIATSNSFAMWANGFGNLDAMSDNDGDGLSNLLEFALGTDPLVKNTSPPFSFLIRSNAIDLGLDLDITRTGVELKLQRSSDLINWERIELTPIGITAGKQLQRLSLPRQSASDFFRIHATLKP